MTRSSAHALCADDGVALEEGVPLRGCGRYIEKVAVFRGDGDAGPRRLAAVCRDHDVYLWPSVHLDSPRPGRPIVLKGHEEWIIWAAFSPDGAMLATASDDATMRLWSTNDPRRPAIVCRGHKNWVKTVEWSPDGRFLATASQDGTLGVWRFGDDRPRYMLDAHPEAIWCVSFSRDGRTIASCGEGGRIRLWDTESGAAAGTVEAHEDDVKRCQFDREGRLWSLDINGMLVRTSADRRVQLRVPDVVTRGYEMHVDDSADIVCVIGPRVLRVLPRDDPRRVLAERQLPFVAHAVRGWGTGLAVGGNAEWIATYKLVAMAARSMH